MKKFLISILIVVPFVVVGILFATGATIVGIADVKPAGIEVRDADNKALDSYSELDVDTVNGGGIVTINVLPAVAKQSITYKNVLTGDVKCKVDLKKIDGVNKYGIVPRADENGFVESGLAMLVIYPTEDPTITTYLNVNVSADRISDIDFYYEDGAAVGEQISIYEPTKLFFDVYPTEAISDDDILWHSSAPQIVRVSSSGVLYPVSRGKATIKVTIVDVLGNRASQSVQVDTTKSAVNCSFASTSEQIDEAWVRDNVLIDDFAEVTRTSDNVFEVTNDIETRQITVETCKKDDWDFEYSYETMYTNNGYYYVDVRYTDFARRTENLDCKLTLNNPNLAEINESNGRITPKKAGKLIITATIGGVKKSMTVIIKERPNAVELALEEIDNATGITASRLWGLYWLKDGGLTSGYDFSLKDGENANYEVLWSVNDESFAEVDDTGALVFKPAAAGNSVIVTATLVVDKHKTRVSKSYRFNMCDDAESLNIGYGDFDRYLSGYANYAAVLQADVALKSTFNVRSDVYGNGFTLSAAGIKNMAYEGAAAIGISGVSDGITLYDISVQNASALPASARGSAISVNGCESVKLVNIIAKNASCGISVRETNDITVEGCVFGNISGNGLYISEAPDKSKITVKNNAFAPLGGLSVLIDADRADGTRPSLQIAVEGFVKNSNYKTAEELKALLAEADLQGMRVLKSYAGESQANRILSVALDILAAEAQKNTWLYEDADGEKYVLAGVLAVDLFGRGGLITATDGANAVYDLAIGQYMPAKSANDDEDKLVAYEGYEADLRFIKDANAALYLDKKASITAPISISVGVDTGKIGTVPNNKATIEELKTLVQSVYKKEYDAKSIGDTQR